MAEPPQDGSNNPGGRMEQDGGEVAEEERDPGAAKVPERDEPQQQDDKTPIDRRRERGSERAPPGIHEGGGIPGGSFIHAPDSSTTSGACHVAFCTLNFHSPALSKACSMNVLFPERTAGEPPFPVFYLLHGLSDDHTIWMRRTSLERYVAPLPLIVVMP